MSLKLADGIRCYLNFLNLSKTGIWNQTKFKCKSVKILTLLCTISSRECEWGQSIQIEFWYWSKGYTGYLIKNNFLSSCCSFFVEIQQTLARDLTFDIIKIPSHDLYTIIYVCKHNIICSLNFFSQQGQKQICTAK